jgi:hypothetical protein
MCDCGIFLPGFTGPPITYIMKILQPVGESHDLVWFYPLTLTLAWKVRRCLLRENIVFHIVEITNTMHKFAPLLYSYMLAPTCSGSSLPSSASFWIRLSYVKIQLDMVVYHIMLVKWPVCRSVVVQSVVLPSWVSCVPSRPGRWHYTQETWTTAQIVHLLLKMG